MFFYQNKGSRLAPSMYDFPGHEALPCQLHSADQLPAAGLAAL